MSHLEIWFAFLTVIRKELGRCLRIWPQTIAAPAVTTTLYFFIFGRVIGSHVSDQGAYSYIQYIVPGLIIMATIINAYINTSSSFFGAKFSTCIEEMLVSPMPMFVIVLGYTMGGVLRGMMVGFVVALVAMVMTQVHWQHPLLIIYTMCLTGVIFALVGIINGVFARKFDDVTWVPSFIIAPLTYFAGVFYSIEMLPPFWQTVSHFDPVYYLVSAFRYSMLGVDTPGLHYSLTISFVLALALFFYANYLLKNSKRLRA